MSCTRAPTAQAASPPHTTLSSTTLLARAKVSFSIACDMVPLLIRLHRDWNLATDVGLGQMPLRKAALRAVWGLSSRLCSASTVWSCQRMNGLHWAASAGRQDDQDSLPRRARKRPQHRGTHAA